MSEPTVSVILPVYNARDTLPETIAGLKAQTLRDAEFIFVDDGSTDDSVELLEQFRREDDRVSVYRQQNQYAGVARNNGLSHARGTYVLFLDADDLFEPELLERTVAAAEATGADAVAFDADTYTGSVDQAKSVNRMTQSAYFPQGVFRPQDVSWVLFESLVPWTQLYRREHIERTGIRYMPLHNSNDIYFNACQKALCRTMTVVPRVLVHHRIGQTDNLQSRLDKAPLANAQAWEAIWRTMEEKGVLEDYRRSLQVKCVGSLASRFGKIRTWEGFSAFYNYLHEHLPTTLHFDPDAEVDFSRTLISEKKYRERVEKLRSVAENTLKEYCRKYTPEVKPPMSFRLFGK